MTVSVKGFRASTASVVSRNHLIIYLLELLIILRLQLVFPVLESLWAYCRYALVQDKFLLLAFLEISHIFHIEVITFLVCIYIVLFGKDDRM